MSSSVSPCPSALFIFLPRLSLSLFRLVSSCASHVQGVPFSQSPTHWRISFFSLSLSFSQASFHSELHYCKLPSCLHCLARSVSSSLQSMIPVCLSVLIPPAVFIAPTLASCSRGEPERARNSPLALRSVFESACRRPNKYQINETAARNLDVLITGV